VHESFPAPLALVARAGPVFQGARVSDFLDKLRANVKRQNGGKLVDLSLAALILAKTDPDQFVNGLKMAAVLYGKPVARATAIAIVETALE